jgi:hypothetical protein
MWRTGVAGPLTGWQGKACLTLKVVCYVTRRKKLFFFLESAGELRIIILRKERSKVDRITTPRPNPQASPTRGSLTGPTRPYLKRQ